MLCRLYLVDYVICMALGQKQRKYQPHTNTKKGTAFHKNGTVF